MGSGPWMQIMCQSSSSVSTVPKSLSPLMRKVKTLGDYRGRELFQGNNDFLLIKHPVLLAGLPLMELPDGKGSVAPFPLWNTPNGHGVAHTLINFSSHLKAYLFEWEQSNTGT